jgi:phytoene dehydrogenase-like protein
MNVQILHRDLSGRRRMAESYDVIVIGGGHNGLTTAAYLAKGGEKEGKNKLKVLVLERYKKVGGAAMSEEIYPGFTYSTCSYVCSLLRPEITQGCRSL